jgi:hypothetical protein
MGGWKVKREREKGKRRNFDPFPCLAVGLEKL